MTTFAEIELPQDAETWRDLLVRAIEEKGADYVYEAPGGRFSSCVYFNGDQPSCLIGHALSYLGVDRDCLSTYGNTTAIAAGLLGTRVPDPVSEALSVAQGRQDHGATWGDALASFDHSIANAEVSA